MVGGPIGEFYGYKSAGIFQTQKEIDDLNAAAVAKYGPAAVYQTSTASSGSAAPGDRKFVDLNHSGHITADSSETSLGSPIPKFYGGVTFDASWKNWDVSVFSMALMAIRSITIRNGHSKASEAPLVPWVWRISGFKYYENAWTPSNPSNRYARIDANEAAANTRPSDVYVENGSYLRMRNLTIGYTVPLKTTGTFAPKIRVYVTGQNLLTITKYSGLDPEIGLPQGTDPNNTSNTTYRNVTGSGVDVGTYPSSRFYVLGLNVTF